MSGSLNRVDLIGNLARDPESRTMGNGGEVVNLTVATNESWKDKQTGERKDKAEFHRVVIFNEHLCKVATQYLRKGSKIFLSGSLQTRKWTDQSGQDKYSTEIVLSKYKGELTMLDGKTSNTDGGTGRDTPGPSGGHLDDDIPFGPCM